MNKIVEILIKGIVTVIWFIATVVTSVILSPFIFIGWISNLLTKPGKDDDQLE
ncbi:hypothetical protein [Dyadobacter diqingensis]|uniref:hypothetical protein n=1 Tax=Dyadobacter diqingensis TaxID=2938121 RepID=UPI0020C18F52|nr:hypothetical protein [Dyadobacter diqingensis]